MKNQKKKGIKKANYLKIAFLSVCFTSFPTITLYAEPTCPALTETSESMQKRTLKYLFSYIEKNTNYIFIYQSSDIDLNQVVLLRKSINLKKQSIKDVLDEIFAGTEISYVINNRQIIVRKNAQKPDELKAFVPTKQSTGMVVSGMVKDNTGMPIIGANVSVKGVAKLVMTDVSGNFQLQDVNPDAMLQISFIGYKTIKTAAKKTMLITMQEENSVLDEVVVVGYGVQKKANLSGAVDAISSKALENRPIVNLGQGLQGLIPNLNINVSNGNSSTAPSFNVRGYTSINGGEPLILVDNVPTSTSELSRLNPSDVLNLSVLKDASSAAIYGARAAFGVILITTKTGQSEKVLVNVNTNASFRSIARLPNIITDPYTVVMMKKDVGKPSYNPVFSDEMVALAKKHSDDPSLSPYEAYPADPTRWAYFGRTNWFKELYKDYSPTYSISADISQKKGKTSFFLSTEYINQEGMLNYGNDKYKRYNLRGKVESQVYDWLKIGNNTSFTNTIYNNPSFGGMGWDNLFYQIAHNHSLLVPKNPDGTWTTDPQGWLTGGRAFAYLQDGGREMTDTREFSTSFTMELSLIKEVWSIKADATFKRSNQSYKGTSLPITYKKGPNLALTQTSANPTASANSWAYNYNIYNVYTDFHKTFGEKHFVNALLGFNQESSQEDQTTEQRSGLISTSYPTIQLATGTTTIGESINTWAVRGAFARLNYIFDNRYIAEFNGRYDGTSRFPKNDRYGFFPSGSVAWVLSREKFMESINKTISLDNLKLRASYGSLGNQNISDSQGKAYPYIPSMASYQSSMILDGKYNTAVSAPGLVSNSLTWEKVSTIDGGVDLLFLKNRLEANFDYYTRYTKGMLTKSVTLPNVLGASEPMENSANLKTKGWEVSLSWRDKFILGSSPFNYNVKVTLADSRAYITKYANPSRKLSDYYAGQEIGEIWGLVTEGFFQSDAEVKSHADQTQVGSWNNSYQFSAGDLKFKNLNNDNVISRGDGTVDNPGDFKVIGNSQSRFPFSIDLNADWKGFDVRAFFQGIGKRDWYPTADNQTFWGIYANPWANVLKTNMDHWTPENPNAYFPRLKSYVARNTGEELACNQTKYLQNASYMRLQNLMIGYTLPTFLTKKASIERVRIYFSAENLFEIDHIHGHNIDASTLTSDANSECIYPMQRTFSFGLNLNF